MNKNEQGLSLVELLVAMVILAIGIAPLVRVLMYGLETGDRANKITLMTNLARDMAEEMRAQKFSEEFVSNPDSACNGLATKSVFPKQLTNPQCFGLESGEDESQTLTSGGRILEFDDVDDYDGWCRGTECPGPHRPLETYDGFQYNGQQGYPAYIGFTRRVRVHNLDAQAAFVTEYRAAPFADDSKSFADYTALVFAEYTAHVVDSTQLIKRYNFDNWSSISIGQAGLTPIKRIEVTVTYSGRRTMANRELGSPIRLEVTDVSYSVMPEVP
jgi:prepilin-type N-terminal cleavage/methylation domain-containing protein